MSLIPQISNPFVDAFAGGLLYGLAVCTASCLPYVTGYIAGVNAGFKKGVTLTLLFSSGRIVAYALVGALVGLFSGLFAVIVAKNAISPFQTYSSIAFGAVTILIGAYILLKIRSPSQCQMQNTKVPTFGRGRFGVDFGAFSLGLSRGLIVCPPLIVLLLYSVPFSSMAGTVALAVLFGLGTTISPILLLGGVTGWLLNKAPLLRRWISIAGAAVLVVLGAVTIVGSIIQL